MNRPRIVSRDEWLVARQKIDGRWRDVHEHASVPIDMATGKGVTDFNPE